MWQYNHTIDPDELCHYGVKGMKWDPSKLRKKGKQFLNNARAEGRALKLFGKSAASLAKAYAGVPGYNSAVKSGNRKKAVSRGTKVVQNARKSSAYSYAGSLQTKRGQKYNAQQMVDARVNKMKKKARKR